MRRVSFEKPRKRVEHRHRIAGAPQRLVALHPLPHDLNSAKFEAIKAEIKCHVAVAGQVPDASPVS
jgi:hypothetical protein